MKKKLIILSMFIFSKFALSQVGINTADPKATFDITAKNTTGNTKLPEGLLIPRVDRERAQSMEDIDTSTMIYVDNITTGTQLGNAVNIDETGYYYFNGTVWVKLKAQSSLLDNNDGTYTYTSENGNTTNIKGNGNLTGEGVLQVNAGTNATDVLFGDATIKINGGVSGQILTTNSSGQAYWNTPKNLLKVIRITGGIGYIPMAHDVILVDLSGLPSTFTATINFITTPILQGYVGKVVTIKRLDDGPATVLISGNSNPTSSPVIFDDTETEIVLPPKTAIQLIQESDALTGFKYQTISKF